MTNHQTAVGMSYKMNTKLRFVCPIWHKIKNVFMWNRIQNLWNNNIHEINADKQRSCLFSIARTNFLLIPTIWYQSIYFQKKSHSGFCIFCFIKWIIPLNSNRMDKQSVNIRRTAFQQLCKVVREVTTTFIMSNHYQIRKTR